MASTDDRKPAKLGGEDAARWWASLGAHHRAELTRLWVAVPLAGSAARPHEVPGAADRFERDDADGPHDRGGWNRDLYEFVVAHDVAFHLGDRVFHICRSHAAARQAVRKGRVPAEFRCPLEHPGCPMWALIGAAGGAGVRLVCRPATPAAEHCGQQG